jgi:hypothetical protein
MGLVPCHAACAHVVCMCVCVCVCVYVHVRPTERADDQWPCLRRRIAYGLLERGWSLDRILELAAAPRLSGPGPAPLAPSLAPQSSSIVPARPPAPSRRARARWRCLLAAGALDNRGANDEARVAAQSQMGGSVTWN